MKKYILILAAFFTVGISACKKDYLSLEVNPNTPSVTTPQLTLSAALNGTAGIIVGQYTQYGVWSGYWTTSGSYVPNQGLNQYQFTNTSFEGDWDSWYANLTNYNVLQGVAAKSPSLAYYQAIAMIMKAYGFSHLVDDFNDVPYTQAFQASVTLYPVYDKGPAIYTDLFKQLDAAIGMIKTGLTAGTATVPGPEDIMFHGAMAKWIQFANTLKLRMAMRVSAASGFTAGTIMGTTAGAADVAGTETNFLGETTSGVVNPGYSNLAGKQNPFWANFGTDPTGNPTFGNVYWLANSFSTNMLKAFNDPRLTQIYALVPTSAADPTLRIYGNTFGDTHATLLTGAFTSPIGPGLLQSPTQGAIILSGAESLFLQAEAVQSGVLTSTGTAQSLYEAGITASFEQLQVGATTALSDAAATTYFGQSINNVGWASSSNKESAIITQKWIALNGYFNFEAWNEYRRTGFPNLPSSIDPAAINPTLPTRIPYPLDELTTNGANLAKEGTINPFTSKIFWAK